MLEVNHLTKKELYEIAEDVGFLKEIECRSIIISPNKLKHDSGYGCFDIFCVTKEKIFVFKGRQDALHLPNIKVNCDVLYKSKLIRYFANPDFIVRGGLSDVMVELVNNG